jgi:hypothetical protein
MKNTTYIALFLLILGFNSCEEVIDIDLKDAPAIVVVDAWITDQPGLQKIIISETKPYFDNNTPTGIAGASVRVFNSANEVIDFTASSQAGTYDWDPATNTDFFATIGERYSLNVTLVDGRVYTAVSQINRVPEVEEIKFTFFEEDAFQDEGYEGEFLATDLEGSGDTYWIKAYKNGQFLNKPFELNTAFDAGFSAGGNVDGVVFIQPIQSGVQELDEELATVLYQPGDSLYVEILSITNEAFYFLEQVKIQTQRDGGFGEIFAAPFENVTTNINSDSTEEQVAGFFNVSSVSGKGMKLE